MRLSEKNKKKHDILNSIVSINSLAKSASHLAQQLISPSYNHHIKSRQINLFLSAMNAIQSEAANIEINLKQIIDA